MMIIPMYNLKNIIYKENNFYFKFKIHQSQFHFFLFDTKLQELKKKKVCILCTLKFAKKCKIFEAEKN